MNNQRIHRIVRTAKVLSDPSRVRLLMEIYDQGELSCGEAEEIIQLSQPTVSHHLKLLGESGLIRTEKKSRHLMMFPNYPEMENFMNLFQSLVNQKKAT